MNRSVLGWLVGSWLAGCSLFCNPAAATPSAPEDPLLAALAFEAPLQLCGEAVPLDDPAVRERLEKEMLISLGNRPQVILWLKRTSRYFPFIERSLKGAGLPDDLKYLAVAESALRLHAGSSKGAMGIWQLMPETAQNHGLRVDARIDQRRNFYHSTRAAVRYLQVLYERFGSWSLALAAYNMGEEGLAAEILEQGSCDYYRLYLPLETQRFVFRILAIRQIIRAPERYGFALDEQQRYAPHSFVPVEVTVTSDTPVRLLARAAGTDFKAIKELNPQIRGHHLASGVHPLSLPPGSRRGFTERLEKLMAADSVTRSQQIYVVQRGDNLATIAERFDVPLASLLIWNRIGTKQVIHPGQRLVVRPATSSGETPCVAAQP